MQGHWDSRRLAVLLDGAMASAGWSLRGLAAQARVPASAISRWCSGTDHPSYANLVRVARALAPGGHLGEEGVAALFDAAGYPVPLDLFAAPAWFRRHFGDSAPYDTAYEGVWASGVAEEVALGMIQWDLDRRRDEATRLAGLDGLLTAGH